MNALRKYLGIIWLLGGILLAAVLTYKAAITLTSTSATTEDYVFWIVIVAIFIPIIIGFILFGFYGMKGEYGSGKLKVES